MKLLIVDDDILVIEGIMASIDWDKLKFEQVLIANCYSEAINIFQKEKIDLLLCDIEMPFGNGINLVQWVRDNKMDTECIFLTCHSEFDFAKQAVSLRCLDYLLKPLLPERLIAVLQNATKVIEEKKTKQYYYQYGKEYVKRFQSEEEKMDKGNSEAIVSRAKAYIMEHISEEISMEELAASLYISPNHLTRSFKKEMGKTPIDFLIEQRMFLAKELLEQNNFSISMISAKVGYGNYSYFTKIFKKFYGKTPREYRDSLVKK